MLVKSNLLSFYVLDIIRDDGMIFFKASPTYWSHYSEVPEAVWDLDSTYIGQDINQDQFLGWSLISDITSL